ncbi:MAG: ComEA family DNA-binding protein [Anaerotignaceae bacterium]
MKDKLSFTNKINKYLIISLLVIGCGLWYSTYRQPNKIQFVQNPEKYYNTVDIAEKFETAMYLENLVNINTATKEELMTVTGIGEITADRIIEYRTENGNFADTAELMNVHGIGEKTYEKFKDRVTVSLNFN